MIFLVLKSAEESLSNIQEQSKMLTKFETKSARVKGFVLICKSLYAFN